MKSYVIMALTGAGLLAAGVLLGSQIARGRESGASSSSPTLESHLDVLERRLERSEKAQAELRDLKAFSRVMTRSLMRMKQGESTSGPEVDRWLQQELAGATGGRIDPPSTDSPAGMMVANLISARTSANETASIATLRNIMSAQAQFQQSGKADGDEDGVGEYGGLLELSGGTAGRMSRPLTPPVLSGSFEKLDGHGVCERSGYCFRIFLPTSRGAGVPEPKEGFAASSGVDPDYCETTWCAYAWPMDPKAGNRTFFINQAGDILASDNPKYIGSANGPPADAAFRERGGCLPRRDIGYLTP